MKRLERVHSLVEFLRIGSPSLDSICRFLVLDTLYEFSAISLLIAIVRSDGTVHRPADFGFDPTVISKISERSISHDTPMNEALRTGKIMESGSYEEFEFVAAENGPKLFPNGFRSSQVWPIPNVGIALSFSSEQIELSPINMQFLEAVGGVLSLKLTEPEYRANLGYLSGHSNPTSEYALTPRQWIILGAIRRGLTNAAIANELEFSESLIRQETVQIYRKMGVKGRKELLDGTFFNLAK